MTPLYRALEFCARHGRWGLVVGLVCGLALPGLASAMRPWLPQMVAGLLFITAFRIGYRASVGQLTDLPRVLSEVLVLQLCLPLLAFALFWMFGLTGALAAMAIVLMLAAPSISGSPNFAILMGQDPAPAMQVLVVGTALFPLTSLPVLLLLGPAFGGIGGVVTTGLNLIVIITLATGAGFALRAFLLPQPNAAQMQRLDGLGVLALAVIVIGLMAGIRPILDQSPLDLAFWVALVFAANFGLQILASRLTRSLVPAHRAAPLSIIAGNRNVALFLLALPVDVTDALLVFIGCYQLPMYLTPLLLRRLSPSA
ncbi:hypothetical protein [Gymnodinialimonas hymeniacidonis]|uniref:hypothetical protein n=1 Tax=Gymnodinialimonas hymeniacidonis TaxID=3126508 RepID=UPI0034C63FF5